MLAGGRSERFGSDKAEFVFYGLTLLERVVTAVCAATKPVIVVGRSTSSDTDSGANYLPDRFPGEGPLGGIITGLHELGQGRHLVCACDLPLLRIPLLRLLLEDCAGFEAAIPVAGGRLNPLCAAYDSASLPKLKASFDSGIRSVHGALSYLHVNRIAESKLRTADSELASLININTPEDLRELLRRRATVRPAKGGGRIV